MIAHTRMSHREDWSDGKDKLIFYYKIDNGSQVYYDLYDKYGSPFQGSKLVLKSPDETCPQKVWDDGTLPCPHYVCPCCYYDGEHSLITHMCMTYRMSQGRRRQIMLHCQR